MMSHSDKPIMRHLVHKHTKGGYRFRALSACTPYIVFRDFLNLKIYIA